MSSDSSKNNSDNKFPDKDIIKWLSTDKLNLGLIAVSMTESGTNEEALGIIFDDNPKYPKMYFFSEEVVKILRDSMTLWLQKQATLPTIKWDGPNLTL